MSTIDVLFWMVGGLVAGILTGALRPRSTVGERFALVATGLLGAGAGGAVVSRFTDLITVGFLAAVCAAVLSSTSLAYLLWRPEAMRYHE
ncbi:MAG TPA: hypothetical protein VNL35_08425 [Chloroflexota bacterium]|nr:hypothetical protein [Chloroflexota bacterium]